MTHSRPGLACALVLFAALGCVLPARSSAAELVVRRDAGLSAGQRADLRANAGVKLDHLLALPDSELVTVPDAGTDQALDKLNADPHVDAAAPNVTLNVAAAADQPDFWYGNQWYLNQNANDADIDAPEAWQELGSAALPAVNVAIVDTQVQSHSDFSSRVDRELARDFLGETTCKATAPVDDHGTRIAGIIGADRNNGGIVGISPSARIAPLRAFDNCGGAHLADVLNAFEYAGEQHIPIVVGSFATDPLDQEYSPEINAAFAELIDRYQDTLFVVAAGNEGSDNGERPVYPCDTRMQGSRVDPPNLICVANSDKSDRPACTSNVGGSVDVFAPGESITSTYVRNGFSLWGAKDGSSFSAAVVAGVAALVNAANPGLIGTDLKDRLLDERSVDHVAGMGPWATSGGRINAAYAIDPEHGDLGDGGTGGEWVSCDHDHDQVVDGADDCPTQAGTVNGCPDVDEDGIRDDRDNCVGIYNPDQSNMDGDRFGDACDDDVDGDSRGESIDMCPRQYAVTPDGCPGPIETPTPTPTPTPPPQDPPSLPPAVSPTPTPVATPTPLPAALKVSLAVSVTPKKCTPGPHCRKAAKVTVKLSRTATVALKIERLVGKKWKPVTSRSLTATIRGKSMTVRGRKGKSLTKGKYRVTAIAAGVRQLANFKV